MQWAKEFDVWSESGGMDGPCGFSQIGKEVKLQAGWYTGRRGKNQGAGDVYRGWPKQSGNTGWEITIGRRK